MAVTTARAGAVVRALGLAVLTSTCGGDEVTRPETAGFPALAAGPAATIKVTIQPPPSALDREVWDPARQPKVTVKDAGGAVVAGTIVTASVASGAGTLEGTLTAKTNASGVAKFLDLGIAGTGAHTLRYTAGAATATSSTVTLTPLPKEAAEGAWDAPVSWDIVPLHMSLLPTGKLLAWGKYEAGTSQMANPRLWDPAAGPPTSARTVPAPDMVFCAGHALMADGRLMVSGGHHDDDRGLDATNIFDPVGERWATGLPAMAQGRWYPTVTTLADGRLVTVAGRDLSSEVVLVPEIWENGRWVRLPGASLRLPYYPYQFVAPNGKVFYAGERVQGRWLDVDATGTKGRGKWTTSTSLKHLWPYNRDYGSAVMYETGKVLVVGGGGDLSRSTSDAKAGTPTATAETIDLNVSGPAWKSTGSMQFARRHLNATILADGRVLATGGTSGGGFNNLAGAVHAAEAWDPKTGQWTRLASNAVDRVYHSVSLLLPDGTVLHGASGDAGDAVGGEYPARRSHELFRPPYLYRGGRPVVTQLSATTLGYGQTVTVTTPHAGQITEVRWIRLGSVTHAFDANQRANTLTFSRGSGVVKVNTPTNSRHAPPGHYLLFLLNRNGVPSTASVVQVR